MFVCFFSFFIIITPLGFSCTCKKLTSARYNTVDTLEHGTFQRVAEDIVYGLSALIGGQEGN